MYSKLLTTGLAIAFATLATFTLSADDRPNIIWINVEDMSSHFGCFGETTIKTPHVDQLAADGLRFDRAYVTAPVCSTSRSAIITGMFQASIGAHHHRSGRGTEKIQLPTEIIPVPVLFQKAGYFTCNGGTRGSKKGQTGYAVGKTDYNFEFDKAIYDGNDWTNRKPGQPFFAQIQLAGGKARTLTTPNPIDPSDVKLPPYYPRDSVILEDWAKYLNSVMNTDIEVGKIVERLKSEGEFDNTVIFFFTDHGISHARGKQFMYEEGSKVPLVVHGPGIAKNELRSDLILQIDITATSLALAGIEIPSYMQGRDLFAKEFEPRQFVVSARDRCDETVDRMRSVVTEQFKYIRNFYPNRPYLQPCAYKDHKPIVVAMRELYAAGKLNDVQSMIMAETRPEEELYDLKNDPNELQNLAADPKFKKELLANRRRLNRWIKETGDLGQEPESASMYDSDMKIYVDTITIRKGKEDAQVIIDNIATMKKWASEGK